MYILIKNARVSFPCLTESEARRSAYSYGKKYSIMLEVTPSTDVEQAEEAMRKLARPDDTFTVIRRGVSENERYIAAASDTKPLVDSPFDLRVGDTCDALVDIQRIQVKDFPVLCGLRVELVYLRNSMESHVAQ